MGTSSVDWLFVALFFSMKSLPQTSPVSLSRGATCVSTPGSIDGSWQVRLAPPFLSLCQRNRDWAGVCYRLFVGRGFCPIRIEKASERSR